MKNSHRIRLISGPGVLILMVIGLIQCNQADDITMDQPFCQLTMIPHGVI